METNIINNIFSNQFNGFPGAAKEWFLFQYAHNEVYRKWCGLIHHNPLATDHEPLTSFPFLPIALFKTHTITSTLFAPDLVFESSGTTQTINSRHLVKDKRIYQQSFLKAFELFYGDVKDWCIIGLLPSYLERKNSSLVMMVDELVQRSNHPNSGFYLQGFQQLHLLLQEQETKQQQTLLIGVTFALLDFAAYYKMDLKHTTVMETGGMKGRGKERTRAEVHQLIMDGLGVKKVHSEYGMTELLSQAYSKGDGRFVCPPWMKVLVRDEADPLQVSLSGRGILNIIDLANLYSCSFIATDDVGMVHEDGSFEVWGRLDNSDIRGCSLLVV